MTFGTCSTILPQAQSGHQASLHSLKTTVKGRVHQQTLKVVSHAPGTNGGLLPSIMAALLRISLQAPIQVTIAKPYRKAQEKRFQPPPALACRTQHRRRCARVLGSGLPAAVGHGGRGSVRHRHPPTTQNQGMPRCCMWAVCLSGMWAVVLAAVPAAAGAAGGRCIQAVAFRQLL